MATISRRLGYGRQAGAFHLYIIVNKWEDEEADEDEANLFTIHYSLFTLPSPSLPPCFTKGLKGEDNIDEKNNRTDRHFNKCD